MIEDNMPSRRRSPNMDCDFLVVGAGMAGASAAYALARETVGKGAKTILLERESAPGYHSTGRSAAVFVESYGDRAVRTLVCCSRQFYANPPPGFADHPIMTPRPLLHVGRADQAASVERTFEECRGLAPYLRLIDGAESLALLPVLRPGYADCAVLDDEAMDMDVHGLHHGYLKAFKATGGTLVTDAEVEGMDRRNGRWSVSTRAGEFTAGAIVNTAGAWADEIARMAGLSPLGLVPKRRTALTFDAPPEMQVNDWPIFIDADEEFYFKPEGGRVFGSPADETPVPPCDVQPEELDIAIAVDRIEKATVLEIGHISHKWAGLRSFFADKTPAIGAHPGTDDFYWMAGQGGAGITTACAAGRLVAALATGAEIPPDMRDLGLTAADVSPARLL